MNWEKEITSLQKLNHDNDNCKSLTNLCMLDITYRWKVRSEETDMTKDSQLISDTVRVIELLSKLKN